MVGKFIFYGVARVYKERSLCLLLLTMRNSWNIRDGMGNIQKGFPPGEFNNKGKFDDEVHSHKSLAIGQI